MYAIEKDVPMPERFQHKPKYPFAAMKVGDSFLVPGFNGARAKIASRLSASVYTQQKTDTARFTVSSVQRGVRVWRVK